MECVGAPENKDKELFDTIGLLQSSTNCYAYAVQDYGAGLIDSAESELKIIHKDAATDFNYMPRPGQTTGQSYDELLSIQPSTDKVWLEQRKDIMRRALKQDGIFFQGMSYPLFVPKDKYVICCFLEPHSYHFIRQNKDGSWTSKNGPAEVTDKANDGKTPLGDMPEIFYGNNPDYPFVGYFFVPKGGIRIGLKQYLAKMPRINKMRLTQILQKQSRMEGKNLLNSEKMSQAQQHIQNAVATFDEVYADIRHLRDAFLQLPSDTDKKNEVINESYEKMRQIARKLRVANGKKVFELRSFLKEKREVSPSRRFKLLGSPQR